MEFHTHVVIPLRLNKTGLRWSVGPQAVARPLDASGGGLRRAFSAGSFGKARTGCLLSRLVQPVLGVTELKAMQMGGDSSAFDRVDVRHG